ncbi:MAG: ATP-binding protein [Casimicrobiaceae bacterium]
MGKALPPRLLFSRLSTKLLGAVALVIVVATFIVWVAIDFFALEYFADLLDKYKVPKKNEVLKMFLEAAHRGLIWASLGALILGLALSVLLIRMILGPLYQMIGITGKIAHGDYTPRIRITSRDEIGELGAAFNAMTDNLQRIEQLRKKMVIDVAHELRGPLTNIRGYLEALSNGVLPATSKIVEALHEETLRLGNLSDDLMRLSVADAARLTLRREPIDLRQLLAHSLNLFQTQFADKAITVETQFSEARDPVDADSEKLAQVAQNLLDNAWRYTPREGHVRVSVARAPKAVKMVVANTGEAISGEDLSLIFERFYRIDKSRSREHGGAGIGLAIVKELIEAHGGQVGAESAAGENRIWFTLPA